MKRILFVITGLKKGGAERQLYNLLLGIKDLYEIEVVCFLDGYYKKSIENLGIKVHLFPIRSNLGIFKAIYKTHRIVNSCKPNIIQSMIPHANIVSKLVNIINCRKYTVYTGVRNSQEPIILGILERMTDLFADKIITNSYTNKEELVKRGFNKDKIEVIYNGVTFDKPKKIYTYNKTILTVAKFYAQKDYETNVAVVDRLSKGRDDFQFLYVGDGPDKQKIEDLVKKKNLEKFIQFLGIRDDIPELMSSADLFFLPTKHEGQANVLLEAMYFGLPIITTDIVENKEICEAYFGEVGDVDFFVDHINCYLDNMIDFTEKVNINRLNIKKFSVDKMVEQYLVVYSK